LEYLRPTETTGAKFFIALLNIRKQFKWTGLKYFEEHGHDDVEIVRYNQCALEYQDSLECLSTGEGNSVSNKYLIENLEKFVNLRELHKLEDSSILLLDTAIEKCPLLKKLEFNEYRIDDPTLASTVTEKCLAFITPRTSIETLDIAFALRDEIGLSYTQHWPTVILACLEVIQFHIFAYTIQNLVPTYFMNSPFAFHL
jgi:hypothetical protein